MYLEERMICDGQHVLHLYDELGLAARRPANDLRLASLRKLAPHFLDPADVLARVFNVELAESDAAGFTLELTVPAETAGVKSGAKAKAADDKAEKLPDVRVTLKVRSDGLVTQKSLFVDGKLAAKLVYEYGDTGGDNGSEPAAQTITARYFDKDSKELAKFEFTAQPLPAEEKPFDAKLADYAVFDMPLRKPSYYAERLKELGDKDRAQRIDLLRHQALTLLQELHWRRWGGSNEQAQKLLAEARKLAEQSGAKPKLGDLALLGASGGPATDFAAADSEAAKRFAPLYGYIQHRHGGWPEMKDHPQTLVGHLSAYHAAVNRNGEPALFQRFREKYADSPLLLAAAYYCSNYGQKPESWFPLYDHPRWRTMAILMSGRQDMTAEQTSRLDTALSSWYRDATKDASATVFDLPITQQIATQLASRKGFEAIVRDQFARAKKSEGAATLLRFAEIAAAWGKKDLAEEALAEAGKRLKVDVSLRETPPLAERAGDSSAALALGQAYWACGMPSEALALYNQVLAGLKAKRLPASPALLAATARLAAQAGDQTRAIELEEQSLAIEHAHLPDLVNLQAYRQRYQWLWGRLSEKVQESAGKDPQATSAWLARAEQAWRQWREVDRENPQMIQQMATAQRTAGSADQAWLYLSTLIDERPKDAASYAGVAGWYAGRNELEQAQQFYAKAFTWDGANPQWLMERAQLLDRLDRKGEARELYQQIISGQWPPGRQGYVEQAKKAIK
jgi:hypothetical protein